MTKPIKGTIKRVEFFCGECNSFKKAYDTTFMKEGYIQDEENTVKWRTETSKDAHLCVHTCLDCGKVLGITLIMNKPKKEMKKCQK